MDQNQSNAQPYGYSDSQNDTFNSFLNNDNESTFNQPWQSQSFNNSRPGSTNPYDQSGHGWPQNALSASNMHGVTNYGIHNGIYDQTYSRSPASFDYSGFNSNANPALSGPPYDHSFTYGPPSTQHHEQFGFSRGHVFGQSLQQTQNQTISPQALQNYSAGYQQNHAQRTPLVCITLHLDAFVANIQTESSIYRSCTGAKEASESCSSSTSANYPAGLESFVVGHA